MKSFFALFATLALLNPVIAHYRFFQFIVNGVTTGEYQYVRSNTNTNSPVTDVASTDMRCNQGGLASGTSTSIASTTAGSYVGFRADQGLIHPGPLLVYLGKVPAGYTAATWDGSGANWFKIYQVGASFSSGSLAWPSDNQQVFNFQIPSQTPSGDYLVRIEHIALHGASTAGGAQHYISCAQLKVTNGGNGNPTKYAIPSSSIYTYGGPGLVVNIYWPPVTSYTPPGPPVWP